MSRRQLTEAKVRSERAAPKDLFATVELRVEASQFLVYEGRKRFPIHLRHSAAPG